MDNVIVVIDIGMTNKKMAVYDESLVQQEAWYQNFAPKMIDGIEAHDLEAMEEWFIKELADIAKKYRVRAIAITTHGASFVCVDKDGKSSVPSFYYTYEPGEDFHRRFYEQFGSPVELQARTGTPYFKSMINASKGIFFVKERYPEQFKNTAAVLLYPQYWGRRFTGRNGIETTYIGNHMYLWDHIEGRPSSVVEKLGISSLLPSPLSHSWDILGTITEELAEKTGLNRDVIVTMGIHDSNSSLLPHFAKKSETGFILNSTGTWCVCMEPVEKYGFAPEELGKVVFFNISAFGKPVKTAIFFGGQEFEIWSRMLMDIHGRTDFPPYDQELYLKILQDKSAFLLPELIAGSGQFPRSKPRVAENRRDYHYADIIKAKAVPENLPPCFRNYETGFAVLEISLVMQSITAIERTGLAPGIEIFTEGGFRKNEAYNVLLSSALKSNPAFITDIAEATALGAAMTAKMALTGKKLSELSEYFEVKYQEVPKADIPELSFYRSAWLEQAEKIFDTE
jgi:sugar (pentulose or hexulose) kinase